MTSSISVREAIHEQIAARLKERDANPDPGRSP
jgi:hypothetical protein